MSPFAIGTAENKSVMPNTNAMLAIFDPNTLPTAISGALSSAAMAETTISGADVPNATSADPYDHGVDIQFFGH